MNENIESSDCKGSPFLPIILLTLAVSFFFIYQLSGVYEQRSQLKAQFNGIQQNIDNQVRQSMLIQQGLETIVRQLLELANNGDKDAKAIIEKYGIKVNQPAGAAPAGTAPVAPPK